MHPSPPHAHLRPHRALRTARSFRVWSGECPDLKFPSSKPELIHLSMDVSVADLAVQPTSGIAWTIPDCSRHREEQEVASSSSRTPTSRDPAGAVNAPVCTGPAPSGRAAAPGRAEALLPPSHRPRDSVPQPSLLDRRAHDVRYSTGSTRRRLRACHGSFKVASCATEHQR